MLETDTTVLRESASEMRGRKAVKLSARSSSPHEILADQTTTTYRFHKLLHKAHTSAGFLYCTLITNGPRQTHHGICF